MTDKTKLTAAIVGSGNIGTDLMYKLERSEYIEPKWMIGIDAESEGMKRAADHGLTCMAGGADELLASIEAGGEKPDLLFEATSAYVHKAYAPKYEEAGIIAIDLTPAAVGPYLCPPVNLDFNLDATNVNMITCGGQATTPIVAAVSSVVDVPYAEIVASISSKSAGPGTRANIDEFTETTSEALEVVGGAKKGKAIIILNPVEPPLMMRNTVFCAIPEEAAEAGELNDKVRASIAAMVERVQEYVPGYHLRAEPQFDHARDLWNGMARVTVPIEVKGRGDYLPDYAGNLDIITAAAARVGDMMVAHRLGVDSGWVAADASTDAAATTPSTTQEVSA